MSDREDPDDGTAERREWGEWGDDGDGAGGDADGGTASAGSTGGPAAEDEGEASVAGATAGDPNDGATLDDFEADDEVDYATRGSPYDLRLAWEEHRPHVLLATALFALGTLAGIAIAASGVDLLAALGVEDLGELFPEDVEFTATFILANNTRAFAVFVLGALTLGAVTVLGLVGNGVLVGWVGSTVAGDLGVGPTLALLVPHGVLELPALFVAAGVAFRLVHLGVNYLRGVRSTLVTRQELGRTALLLLVAWIALAVAAVVEVYVTPAIAEALFGIDGTEGGVA